MKGKLLIVDDDRDTLMAMAIRLKREGYEIVVASDGVGAVQMATREKPDAILLDIGLPAGDGIEVLRRLRSLNTIATIPTLIFTARDPATWKEKALEAGAVAFLQKPVDNQYLLTKLDEHIGVRTPPKPYSTAKKKILIVEDDVDTRQALSIRLKHQGYSVVTAADVFTATTVAKKEMPDLMILDIGLPGGDGVQVIERFKSNEMLASVPIIVLSARDPEKYRPAALKAGAAAYFQKPADNDQFMEMVRLALG